MAEIQTITGERLCTLTGLSDRRHRQLADSGYFPPPIKGQYQLTPTIQGMFRYYRELQSRTTDDFALERLRKTRAEANLAELRLSRERKESLDATSVFKAWENILLTLRQKILALPSKIAPRLVYLEHQHDIEAEMEKEVREALVDHWTACQSVVLAGGGIQGGQTYGRTDEFAEYPVEKIIGPEHVAHTVYHAMGIDDLTATDITGRPFNILEKGRPLTELF